MRIGTCVSMIACGSFLALMAGCSKVPQQELDAAKAAIEVAKKAESNVYNAEQFNSASSSLDQALTEVEKQNSAFPLVRNYKKASEMLAVARKQSEEAVASTIAAKEQAKGEAEAMLASAQTGLADAKALLAKAPKGKEGAEALKSISDELATVEASITEASTDMEAGNYITVKDKVSAAQQKIMSLSAELNEAIAKKTGKK